LRYRWLKSLAQGQRLNAIATAHTLDDQAETVLLKLLRGAGTRGLAGIYPVLDLTREMAAGAEAPNLDNDLDGTAEAVPFQSRSQPSGLKPSEPQQSERGQSALTPRQSEPGQRASTQSASQQSGPLRNALLQSPASSLRIIRPLLGIRRDEVESYLTAIGQSWREDESNRDRRFLRNRVRHELLPLLEREFNPNVRQVLSDLGEVSRGEEEYWREQVACELARRTGAASDSAHAAGERGARDDHNPVDALMLAGFAQLPLALQRRLLKGFAERQGLTLDFEHVESLRSCALGERSKAELLGCRVAVNQGGVLTLRMPERRIPNAYRYILAIPGEVHVPELGLTLRALVVRSEFAQEAPPGELLSSELVGSELVVRNWCPGDRFRPIHSRSEEKLKRLFAEKRIRAEERPSWPVVLSGEEIVWVRGFPVANEYQWRGKGDGVLIEVVAE
jgi:tRNA(Ile)-lysidine synthase